MLHLVFISHYQENIFLCRNKNVLNFILDVFLYAEREVTAQSPDYILLKAANQSSNLNW